MASTAMDSKLRTLRDETLKLARESLDEGQLVAYRTLNEFAERITGLLVPTTRQSSEVVPHARTIVSIWARYKGTRYDAELDTSRIEGGRGHCVRFRDQWMSVSAAAVSITGNAVNGWRFWRYRRDDGRAALIDELRK